MSEYAKGFPYWGKALETKMRSSSLDLLQRVKKLQMRALV